MTKRNHSRNLRDVAEVNGDRAAAAFLREVAEITRECREERALELRATIARVRRCVCDFRSDDLLRLRDLIDEELRTR